MLELKAKDILNKKFAKINENEVLAKAITIFEEEEPDIVIVFNDEGEYVGVLAERWIYRSRLDPSRTKVKTLARHVPKATLETSLVEIARRMLENYVPAVPVFSNDEVVGIVTDVDLLAKVVEKEFGNLKVIELATRDVVTINPKDTIGKTLATFRDHNISRIPVVDEDGNVVGIVTMHDIVTKILIPRERARAGEFVGEKLHPLSAPVKSIMSSPVITVSDNASVKDVVELVRKYGISGVPILSKQGKLVGIITKRDLLEAIVKYGGTQEEKKFILQLAGDFDVMDDFEREHIRKDLENFLEKIKKSYDEAMLVVHFKKLGEKNRYLIRMRLIVPGETFNAHAEGFNIMDVMEIVKDKLERLVYSTKEKEVDLQRHHKYLSKYEFWM